MSLCVARAARHGPNRQHDPTLTLFEIRLQQHDQQEAQPPI